MNTFLKKVSSSSNRKDDIIKQSIIANLSNVIKEIQYASVNENKADKISETTEAANELCSIIEAMFLHGLRDTVTHRFKKALARIDEKPQSPDFWAPLLIISHKQIIDQISELSQINTDVGQCRAWIRIALNDCLLSSYLLSIRQDRSALKSYYKANAYIRDNDLLEVAQRLIDGIEGVKIATIPTNSSLLNTWQMQSLVLAGIWSPTLKNTPLAPCNDVAMIIDEESKQQQQLLEEISETTSLCSTMSLGSQTTGLRKVLAFSEDEVLKLILAKDKVENSSDLPCSSSYSSSDIETNKNCVEDSINHNMGNSLNREGWSFDETRVERENHEIKDSKGNNDIHNNTDAAKAMEDSFTALVENYNMVGGSYIRTPDIRGMWQKFEHERVGEASSSPSPSGDEPSMVSSVSSASIVRSESMSLSTQVSKIAVEKGLDAQNYECAGCKVALDEQHYHVCYFTGNYFCGECMSPEKISIPARIIHNWDFKCYAVSSRSFSYLNEIKDYPVIDFKSTNPFIYGASEEMAELQVLRNQLNFLRAYLYTCREPIIEQLQKQMWPREYMYEHIHQYSISDLHEIQNNVLAQQLQKVVKFGKDHVLSCWLCSQKGFVCEICTNPKPLFPFDVESVYRCDTCNAVYHKNCLNSTKPCRKCERRKKREEPPILGAIHTD